MFLVLLYQDISGEEKSGTEGDSSGEYTTDDETEHSDKHTAGEESETETHAHAEVEEGETDDDGTADQDTDEEQLWKNERRHSGDGEVAWHAGIIITLYYDCKCKFYYFAVVHNSVSAL